MTATSDTTDTTDTSDTTDTPARLRSLQEALGDRVVTAADVRYDALRAAWNFAVDQRPLAVHPDGRTARVAGGAVWNDVLAQSAPHGLTALHGSAGDVGVVGYLLGGGLSFYGRAYGLAVGDVRSIEVITADGEPPSRQRR